MEMQDSTDMDIPSRSLKIAVIGSPGVGKTVLAGNFLKGYIEEDKMVHTEVEDLMHPEDGVYEVDLDYNNFRYHITIQEKQYSKARGNFLDSFDGIIYMFSCTDTDSFISLREFFIRQIAAEAELKPRVAVGNKLDLVTDEDIRQSFETTNTHYYTKTGGLNLKETRRWVTDRMMCDYAEISAEDPGNVDEILCMLIDIIDKSSGNLKESIASRTGEALKAGLGKCLDYMSFCQIFLAFVSLFGLVGLGAGFYSGTRLEGYTDDNWVFVVILFLGIFSFVAGIVGFYGAKYRSKEYLKTVLFILFPVTFLYFIFVIFFFIGLESIKEEEILKPVAANFIAVFNVFDLIVKIIAIILLMKAIKKLREHEVETTTLSKALNNKNNYKGVIKSFRDEPEREESFSMLSENLNNNNQH